MQPLSLIVALSIFFALRRQGVWLTWAVRLSVAVALLSMIGLGWKLLPISTQQNLPIVALLLPTHLAVATVLILYRRGLHEELKNEG